MSYTMRNTVILGILGIMVIAAGTYTVTFRFKRSIDAKEIQLRDKNGELEMLRIANRDYNKVESHMNAVRSAWLTLPKRIQDVENSAASFSYFNALASQPDSRIDFNYRKNHRDAITRNNIITNTYLLSGEASYENLFRFIWKFEHNAPLYTIEELEITSIESGEREQGLKPNKVRFIMTITGYSYGQSLPEEQYPLREKQPVDLSVNPFYPLVQKRLPPNEEYLLEVGKAALIGLTQTTAYIRDTTGKTWALHVGDAVYLGKLTQIFHEKRIIEFTLNEGGFARKIQLRLEFNKYKPQ